MLLGATWPWSSLPATLSVGLGDECFVAMLALVDRMTVLSTRQATCETEVFVQYLAAVLVISKQWNCVAELKMSPKDIIG